MHENSSQTNGKSKYSLKSISLLCFSTSIYLKVDQFGCLFIRQVQHINLKVTVLIL